MTKKSGLIWFIVYSIFGFYLINSPLNIVQIPEIISQFDSWIIFVGGILVLIGGINHFRVGKSKKNDFILPK